MRQLTTTNHELQIAREPGGPFAPALSGMFQEANALAMNGRTHEALLRAQDIRVENYGDMHGVTFRVVTKTETVSVLGSFESAGLTHP